MDNRPDLDLLDMPPEALAAYWLSLKRLLDEKQDKAVLQAEAQGARERFVRHLLEGVVSGLGPERFLRLAQVKKRAILTDLRRKFAAMQLAIRSVAGAESPRITLIRMLAVFPAPPIAETKAGELAQALQKALAEKPDDAARLVGLDLRTKPDRLLVKLLFLLTLARREGKAALRPHLPHLRVGLLAEGLSLAADGMDGPLVLDVAASLGRAMLADAGHKLDLCVDMAMGLKTGTPYEELHLTALSYLP